MNIVFKIIYIILVMKFYYYDWRYRKIKIFDTSSINFGGNENG